MNSHVLDVLPVPSFVMAALGVFMENDEKIQNLEFAVANLIDAVNRINWTVGRDTVDVQAKLNTAREYLLKDDQNVKSYR